MSAPPKPSADRPLRGAAKAFLVGGAAAAIGLFYLYATLVTALLLVLLAFEFLLMLVLLRFGLAGLLLKVIERHSALLALVGKSFLLRRGAIFRLELRPEEAPGLTEQIARLAARLQIKPPDALYLEMDLAAWVELRGLRRNLGRTHIGIGFDLLAALSASEVEAVLAHELVHAKLVRRALQRWLRGGLGRAARLSNQLSDLVEAWRRAKKSFATAQTILWGADRLTRLCARMVSAYSRQDEFEADHGAAELCGSGPIGAALLRLEAVEERISRLPWNERVAQIQAPGGFSAWLLRELASIPPTTAAEAAARPFNPYSSHPSLGDRVAALPPDGRPVPPSPPGLALLADPDDVARKLVAHIRETLLKEEEKDRRRLRRLLRQTRAKHKRSAGLAMVVGGMMALTGLATGVAILGISIAGGAALIVGSLVFAFLVYRFTRPEDGQVLPVPAFAAMLAGWEQKNAIADLGAAEKAIEQELRDKPVKDQAGRSRREHLVDEAYGALGRCDFLRAHVASRLGLKIKALCVESALASAVASAAFGQERQSGDFLRMVMRATALKTPSTRWGAAWAFTMLGDWALAEALLGELLAGRPDEPTFLGFLARCQAERGKMQGAIVHARKAAVGSGRDPAHVLPLVRLLLGNGDLAEAADWLEKLPAGAKPDTETDLLKVRLHLLRQQPAEASPLIGRLTEGEPPVRVLFDLGAMHERARLDAAADTYYRQTLDRGHHPEALLGLSRLSVHARDPARARSQLYTALDTTRPMAGGARTPFNVFGDVLGHLVMLEDPVANCRAWIARLGAGEFPGDLGARSFMVFAPGEADARRYLQRIVAATQPGKEEVPLEKIAVQPVPADRQPVVPVRPGVQHVYS